MGNTWGGIFTAFPAAFSTTFLIYYRAHGKEVIPSLCKGLFFPGIYGFILYSWIAGYAYPELGIIWGTVLAYAATVSFYFVYSTGKKSNL